MDTDSITPGDTIRAEVSGTAPAKDDPHPENPSVTRTVTHEFEGEVLEVKDSGFMIDTSKGKMRVKPDEVAEIVERGDRPAPIEFSADGEEWRATWNSSQDRYEVQGASEFDVWGSEGDVGCRLDVYKNVDPRVREDVRETMNAVANALKVELQSNK